MRRPKPTLGSRVVYQRFTVTISPTHGPFGNSSYRLRDPSGIIVRLQSWMISRNFRLVKISKGEVYAPRRRILMRLPFLANSWLLRGRIGGANGNLVSLPLCFLHLRP